MKPLMCIPPAQAEALYDAQPGLTGDLLLEDRFASLPWADDDGPDGAAAPGEDAVFGAGPPADSGRRMLAA